MEQIIASQMRNIHSHFIFFTRFTIDRLVQALPGRYLLDGFDACQGARLNVLDLIKAPTAAAVAYSLTNPSQGKRNVPRETNQHLFELVFPLSKSTRSESWEPSLIFNVFSFSLSSQVLPLLTERMQTNGHCLFWLSAV